MCQQANFGRIGTFGTSEFTMFSDHAMLQFSIIAHVYEEPEVKHEYSHFKIK
jgi:hypothetical protein